MVTNLGKFLRKLRIDKDELLLDMAQRLEVSAPFLSKVETGKKKPPKEWKEKMIDMYNIKGNDREIFEKYFFEAENQRAIDLSNYNETEKDIMIAFARRIDGMNEEKINKIKKIIEEK